MESGPITLAGFKRRREAVNSLCKKVSETFTRSSVVALQNQGLLEKQVEMTCGQQPRISHF